MDQAQISTVIDSFSERKSALLPLLHMYQRERGWISPETMEGIHKEIREIIQQQYERARSIIVDNRDELDLIAGELLEHETLTGEEVAAIIRGDSLEEYRAAKERARRPATPPAKVQGEDEPDVGLSGAEGLAHP